MEDNTDHPLAEVDDSDQDNMSATCPEESNNLGTPQQPQINTRAKKYDDQTLPENETQTQPEGSPSLEDTPLFERSQRAKKCVANKNARAAA